MKILDWFRNLFGKKEKETAPEIIVPENEPLVSEPAPEPEPERRTSDELITEMADLQAQKKKAEGAEPKTTEKVVQEIPEEAVQEVPEEAETEGDPDACEDTGLPAE